MQRTILAFALALAGLSACQGQAPDAPAKSAVATEASQSPIPDSPASRATGPQSTPASMPNQSDDREPQLETATLGAGCYWCVEAVLQQVDGVKEVVSGFMGGDSDEATYEQVCRGNTGHAEVVQVTFDPKVLPYEELLDWFWRLHDPTTLNRQGADVGTQYRSVIFYHSPEQRRIAEASRQAADASGHFAQPIVTEISPAGKLITGPDKHQDYYRQNRRQGYCQMVIAPKLRKLGLEE